MTLMAESLTCERNGRVIFSKLNLTIPLGQWVELRGNNGSGKSSLLRLLAGLVPAASGRVSFEGQVDFKTQLHFIAHQEAIKNALTVADNLQFWCDVLGGTSVTKALEAFALTDLKHEPAQLLSAGQRRRLTLARLFLAPRPLWLLDEPMTALDQTTQALLQGHMADHIKRQGIVVMASHGDHGFPPHQTITLGQP
jgi:heme exporter protein A